MTKTQEIEKVTATIDKMETELGAKKLHRKQLVQELLDECDVLAKPSRKPRNAKASVDTSAPAAPKAPRKPRADGIPARILALLAANATGTFDAGEMASAIRCDDKVAQVRTTLSRMLKTGKIASHEKGKYRHKAA
jgi:hypothetical protein